MIPGCIRGPRSAQGSSDDVSKQNKSIIQVSNNEKAIEVYIQLDYIVYANLR